MTIVPLNLVDHTPTLYELRLQETNISEIHPKTMIYAPQLKHYHMRNAGVTHLTQQLQVDMMQLLVVCDLSHNPLCEDSKLRSVLEPGFAAFACHEDSVCHADCVSEYERKNGHCDSACNHAKCNWDDGDCGSLIPDEAEMDNNDD